MIQIKKYSELETLVQENELVFVYISQPQCSVCKSLLPKVEEMIDRFPKIIQVYIDTIEVPEAAGQLSVFSIPTVMLFVQGKEQFKLVRTFGVIEIEEKIERIYAHFN